MHLIGRHTTRKPKSVILIDDPDCGSQVERETLCCVHCRKHWVVEPGSGKKRGFCYKCMGATCGCRACDSCVPFEKSMGW